MWVGGDGVRIAAEMMVVGGIGSEVVWCVMI